MNGYLLLVTIHFIYDINKIIYFPLKFDGTGIFTERYGVRFRWNGTEDGLSFTERDGVRFKFIYAARFRIEIFRPVSLSTLVPEKRLNTNPFCY